MHEPAPTFLTALKRRSGGFFRRLFFGTETAGRPLPPGRNGSRANGSANGTNGRSGAHRIIQAAVSNGHAKSHTAATVPVEEWDRRLRHSWYGPVKWFLDVSLALFILIIGSPVILVALLVVRLTSRGPALYKQTRVGRDGRPFTIYKIRTMFHDCESLTGARWSTPGDTRITPVGRFLRKTHIDELPQLWNVVRGEMSLIGPRPERPEFVPQLERAISLYRARLLVRPGLTGLAQIQLPPDTNLESVRLKLAYDLWYVRHRGLLLDARIFFGTAFKLFGVPFGVIRGLLGLARRERIVAGYEELAAKVSKPTRPAAQAACS